MRRIIDRPSGLGLTCQQPPSARLAFSLDAFCFNIVELTVGMSTADASWNGGTTGRLTWAHHSREGIGGVTAAVENKVFVTVCSVRRSEHRDLLDGRSCLISRSSPSNCERESTWVCMSYGIIKNKLSPIEGSEDVEDEDSIEDDSRKKRKSLTDASSGGLIEFPSHSNRHQDSGNCSAADDLIPPLSRDITINCLIRCSRSDYGSIASLNRSFRSLIRSGEIYKLRRQMNIAEHWVYFSCNVLGWEAYDPYRHRWINLPRMPPNECFMCSDKESLAVGAELLVFGKEVTSHIVLRYSILTNSWSPGKEMNSPRCLFGSASLGEKAIVAGGTDARGNILSSAELYNSELQTWETLPSMNVSRKMCSGVFMDGKFYVIGGMMSNTEVLTCGEEYDLERGIWRVIPNMSLGLNGASGAPPLVAVVNNKLFAADYASKEVKEYDKENNTWITLGRLPERPVSVNGWGVAFRACGEQLIVIGGPRGLGGGMIELNAWIPDERPPEWNMIASKHSGSFVYNCAVMSC
ncbi:F-box/kelch-repeat protein SKIP11 [Apostasia shenzhenica]|uniref:F-box/kelch-repeat protein SKIP11 n=1 Tax=Apostasia shenzhenica TaxID=1088818 RepID=A0A2I0A714_9ASPA|nr:F-box/kelch-repeat protein SKIP11 [Apostasia shenzhenica]